ncbi:MAG: diacylglycerol kinase family protein [Proteobacteria bacterium]|nr:diacylglycerol kinase family protein [Pseudomonadota bacterium]MDA1058249.1 diacylglycerol kinase family protein [Pseudomonadota bacterium]
MARRIVIIRNPTAGRRRARLLDAVCAELAARGCAPEVVTTQGPDHAVDLARSADADLVVAAGGDGTINEVVHGLMTRSHGARPAFATVPMGTINVLALELGLPRDAAGLAQVIAQGSLIAVTVGCANGRHFLLTAGAGVDAAAVRFLSPGMKRWFGQGAYYLALVRALIAEGNTVFTVEIDGETHRVSSVIVTNAARYAGDKVVAPDASLTGRDVHVLLGTRHGRWNLIRYGAAYMRGVLPTLPDVRIVPVQALRIAEPAGKPVQLDGDNRLVTPVDVAVVDAPLMVASFGTPPGEPVGS